MVFPGGASALAAARDTGCAGFINRCSSSPDLRNLIPELGIQLDGKVAGGSGAGLHMGVRRGPLPAPGQSP